jgi:type II secretion system protein I
MSHLSLKMNDHQASRTEQAKGFALVEILIAVAILSIVLLSVISGVTSSIYVITGMKNYTKAMLIARTRMNDFILNNMKGTDLKHEQVREYPGFDFSRVTRRFEHPLLQGPIPVNITDIIVNWSEKGREREYKLSYIYQSP